jgi:hypothetical protein
MDTEYWNTHIDSYSRVPISGQICLGNKQKHSHTQIHKLELPNAAHRQTLNILEPYGYITPSKLHKEERYNLYSSLFARGSIYEYKMGGTCDTGRKLQNWISKCSRRTWNEDNNFICIGINGTLILKLELQEQCVRKWIGFIWFWIGPRIVLLLCSTKCY